MRHVFPCTVLWVLSTLTNGLVLADTATSQTAIELETRQKILNALSGGHAVAPEYQLSLQPIELNSNGLGGANQSAIYSQNQTLEALQSDANVLNTAEAKNHKGSDSMESHAPMNELDLVSTGEEAPDNVSDVLAEEGVAEFAEVDPAQHQPSELKPEDLKPVAELGIEAIAPMVDSLVLTGEQDDGSNAADEGELLSDEPFGEEVPSDESLEDELLPVAELAKNYKITTMTVENAAAVDGEQPPKATENKLAEQSEAPDKGHFFEPPPPEQHFSIEVFGWAPLTDDDTLSSDELLALTQSGDLEEAEPVEETKKEPQSANAPAQEPKVKTANVGFWLFVGGCFLAIFVGLRWLHRNLFNRSLFA